MKNLLLDVLLMLGAAVAISCCAREVPAGETRDTQTAVTVYNQGFGVVRQVIDIETKDKLGQVSYADVTAKLEPDSVILRSLGAPIIVVEQNYRNDPVSQGLLLQYYEGQTINFLIHLADSTHIEKGKIVRSGYQSASQTSYMYNQNRYGYQPYQQYPNIPSQPLIEVNGELRFGLPGDPLFPKLPDDSILKPTLTWLIAADKPGKIPAELAYSTWGMNWEADYNVIAADKEEDVAVSGWVTIDNFTGKTFKGTKIKLIAGDVSKIVPSSQATFAKGMLSAPESSLRGDYKVQEKSFSEYHMYTLPLATDLLDMEKKQVEFVTAEKVKAEKLYVYDGAQLYGYSYNPTSPEYGTQCNEKVWVMRTFKNSKENGLGVPLPKGRVRFYLRDDDGRLEFTGENNIDHTPVNEDLRIYVGNAFDIVGERKQVNFNCQYNSHWADESFEIKVRNHKKEAVDVKVVEHLYRWVNWEIRTPSQDFKKTDARTIEFPVTIKPEGEAVATPKGMANSTIPPVNIKPEGEAVITYTVHYTW